MARATTKKAAKKPAKKTAKKPARKTPARKTTARKAPARKPAARKAPARKVAAKKAAPQPEIRRIRTAKGRRPYFFDDHNVDKLLAMLMALAGEVSVIRERVDTHERLAEKKKLASSKAIEAYKPTDAVDAERVKWRADYVARILRIVTDELEQVKRQETDKQYEKIVEEVSK
jgi:hypothetical protein